METKQEGLTHRFPELLLASASPRRHYLLREAGIPFEVRVSGIAEVFPAHLPTQEVAAYVARLKAQSIIPGGSEFVLAADTTVILGNKLLQKPIDRDDAVSMLDQLSGQTHTVITGICIIRDKKETIFSESTRVTFNRLTFSVITSYVDVMKPFDKAGAYGIQECLPAGMDPCSAEEREFLKLIGNPDLIRKTMRTPGSLQFPLIAGIEGSYFNVMGLPIHTLHHVLRNITDGSAS